MCPLLLCSSKVQIKKTMKTEETEQKTRKKSSYFNLKIRNWFLNFLRTNTSDILKVYYNYLLNPQISTDVGVRFLSVN